MTTDDTGEPREAYKTRGAVNDLLGLSSAVGLLVEGIERRFQEEEIQTAFTDEQVERLNDCFVKLHRLAEDVADFAREMAEQLSRS